jgi:hypothetical protein
MDAAPGAGPKDAESSAGEEVRAVVVTWTASGSFDSAARDEAARGCAQDDGFYLESPVSLYEG